MELEFDNEKKIPRTMSTQHPDNVNVPEWNSSEIIDGNAEIFEAHFAYETLGCQEVMWDAEGKDVDTRVVRKLLTQYKEFFTAHTLGKDIRLTYRIPNPRIEVVEKKVFVETLQNIPVAYDVASSFYKKEVAPIIEVILPFTTDGKELIMLCNYYKKVIIADEDVLLDASVKVKDWVGDFKPKSIKVIPLVEDFDSLLGVDHIVEPYIDAVKPSHLRVFLARSDPALNYGLLCAVLLTKIALSKLKKLEKKQEVTIHPIIGAGSKPFRGHLAPDNIENFLQEYRGLATVTIQSAFRYDYPLEQVKECVKLLNEKLPNGEPTSIGPQEEKILLKILQKCKREYESVIENLAPLVNSVAPYVPQRRARKLHIGLFGYSRNVAGVNLPRAITFAAALYSIGVPPEFIGSKVLEDLNDSEIELIQKHYVNMKHDFSSVGGYFSWQNINMLMENHKKAAERACMSEDELKIGLTKILDDLKAIEEKLDIKLGPRSLTEKRHENFANNFLIAYIEHEDDEARKALVEAAKLRRCLG
jgi:phosphoenolpyruvate carboxylase